jgi:predicted negative regulator of RcsB-dependent stress response
VFGKAFTVLVLVAATVAVGYTAWETRNLKASLDRMAVGNETRINEMMLALAHTEGQLARIRETVELLDGTGSGTAQGSGAATLEGKITATLTAAQREVLQQELGKWTRQLREQREKGWAALRQGLEQKLSGNAAEAGERDQRWRELKALVERNQRSLTAQLTALGSSPSGAIEEQGATLTNLEKRLGTVLEETKKGQQALNRQNQRDDKRWEDLLLALRENMEATQQRYAELAARLDEQRGGVQKPASAAQPEQEGQTDPKEQDTRERLVAFCDEVPQSALCQDL